MYFHYVILDSRIVFCYRIVSDPSLHVRLLVQIFCKLIVSRFQSINPDKDGGNVKGISDLKNEVKIITSRDELFGLWKEFLERHTTGSLINPDTMERFNQAKNFKVTKNFTLAREFFKPLGHLTDNDLKIFVQHLLGRTPNREWLYPKVTVHKTSKVHCSHYSAAEWVDRRKKKMIVLQELNDIDHSLEVVTAEGTVDNDKWRAWKRSHNVSSAAWNVLLTIIPAPYFAKRLTNEGKLKRASEFQEKFPVVLHVLSNFLRLKKNFKVAGGSGKFRTINSETILLGRDWTYETGRRLSLAIMDLRETPGHNVAQDHAKQAYFHLRMSTLLTLKHPSMTMPAIWVWIVNSPNRLAQQLSMRGLTSRAMRSYSPSTFQRRLRGCMTSQPTSNLQMSSSSSS
jgi:hypothetical protein